MNRMDAGDSMLNAALDRLTSRQVPGVSAAIVRGDGSEFASSGVADIASGRAASPETSYLWFSMTKIVTATAVMQLAEQGALSLDDPVGRFLPGFPEPRSGWPTVRVRHLVSHSSGVANPIPVRWVHPAGSPGVSGSELTSQLLAKHDRLRFPAGSKAAYSNLGYIALGEVIASAAGTTYEQCVQSRILDPLGMADTGFTYPAGPGAGVATGYQRRLHPMTPLFRVLLPKGIVGSTEGRFLSFKPFLVDGPAYGGLVGSVRDAARFMAVHLNGGEYEGVRCCRRRASRRCRPCRRPVAVSTSASGGSGAAQTERRGTSGSTSEAGAATGA